MTEVFSRRSTVVGDVHVVELSGELDMATAQGLSDWLVKIAGSDVVVDLTELTFMDSSGIKALVMARNRIVEQGNDLFLTRPQPIVRRVLEITGLASWVFDRDTCWGT
jgi:anti-anti-sigma factor